MIQSLKTNVLISKAKWRAYLHKNNKNLHYRFFYYFQDKKVVEKMLPVSILASINMKVATTYCGSN